MGDGDDTELGFSRGGRGPGDDQHPSVAVMRVGYGIFVERAKVSVEAAVRVQRGIEGSPKEKLVDGHPDNDPRPVTHVSTVWRLRGRHIGPSHEFSLQHLV